jgi:DNA repair protein RAD5
MIEYECIIPKRLKLNHAPIVLSPSTPAKQDESKNIFKDCGQNNLNNNNNCEHINSELETLYKREHVESLNLNEDFAKHGIKSVPYPFQRASIQFCKNNRNVLLTDDMGLGKTFQTLCIVRLDPPTQKFFHDAIEAKRYRGNTLIICPKIVMEQWCDEYMLHTRPMAAAHTPFLYHSSARTGNATPSELCSHEIVVTTYDFLRTKSKNDFSLLSVQWWRVVLDEAHVIKNHLSKRFEVVDLLESTRRIALSGTPIHNNLGDLFPIFRFFKIFRGFLYNAHLEWVNNVTLKLENKKLKKSAIDYVHTILKPIVVRRMKRSAWRGKRLIESLPQKVYKNILVPMHEDEVKVYNAIEKASSKHLDGLLQSGESLKGLNTAFGKLHALRMCCVVPSLCINGLNEFSEDVMCALCDSGLQCNLYSCGCTVCESCMRKTQKVCVSCESTPVFASSSSTVGNTKSESFKENLKISSKMRALSKILHETPLGEKTIVFSSWVMVLDAIESTIPDAICGKFTRLDGTMDTNSRKESIKKFKNDSSCTILLMTIGAGSTGLDLKCANRVIFVDPQWNPALESQAEDRVYRIGQTKTCHITRLMQTIEGRPQPTIELIIRNIQKSKTKCMTTFFPS